jgi:outer membrane protein assembly factor BamB
MGAAALLVALAALQHGAFPPQGTLDPAPTDVWSVRWTRQLVPPDVLEWKPREPAGPAADAVTGTVVAGTRDGVLRGYGPDGRPLWRFAARDRFVAAPRVAGPTVYVGSIDGVLYAIDVASGRERWRYAAGEEVGTTPVVADGVVYVATLQDTLLAIDAATGAWRWHHRRDAPSGFTVRGAAGPAVAGGTVYGAFSDGSVVALDAATGAVRWQSKVAPAGAYVDVDSTPVVSEGRVYVAAFSGAVVALDAATGAQEWLARTPGASRVALAGDVVVATTTTQVLGVARADGSVLWTAPLDGEPGEPVVVGRRVFVANGRRLLGLDARSGRRLVTFDPGTGVSAPPAVHDDRMYLVSNGGALVALDLR